MYSHIFRVTHVMTQITVLSSIQHRSGKLDFFLFTLFSSPHYIALFSDFSHTYLTTYQREILEVFF